MADHTEQLLQGPAARDLFAMARIRWDFGPAIDEATGSPVDLAWIVSLLATEARAGD
jgi:hypothetical protein